MKQKVVKEYTMGNLLAGVLSSLDNLVKGYNPHRKDALIYQNDICIIDTCYVEDTGLWETGLRDVRYLEDGSCFIISEYETKEEAYIDHEGWVKVLTSDDPPKTLIDIHMGNVYTIN